MKDCIFCEIIKKNIPAEVVYEDNLILSFKDINPKAKTHLLVIPKVHIKSLLDLTQAQQNLITHLIYKIPEIAKIIKINGFRTIINTGKEGGQVVDHLHFHILSPVNP